MNKYILIKNNSEGYIMRYANTDFHRNMVDKNDEVFGGGMFAFSEDNKTMTLYGKSEDYGKPMFENIKEKIHTDEELIDTQIMLFNGYDCNWKPIYENITNKFIFDYW